MINVTIVSTPDDGSCGIGTYTGNLIDDFEDDVEVNHITVPLRSKNPVPYLAGAVQAGFASTDVIHVQHEYGIFGPKSLWSWLFFPILYLITKLRGTPVVVTLHSAWNRETVGPPLVPLKRVYVKLNNWLIASGMDFSVFLSENCHDQFVESTTIGRHEVMAHGVPTDTIDMSPDEAKQEFGYEPDDSVVVVPGYIRAEKGQDMFVEIAEQVPEHEFLIGGGTQAEEAESFRREVEQAAPENVRITGILDNQEFHAVFIAADLVVLPYRKVTQSGIFNLCVAYEVPTLASDKPYFARLETEWNCIELFDPENPAESANLVRSVLNDESLREELLVGMRDYKKTSSMDAVVEKHTNIYSTLAA